MTQQKIDDLFSISSSSTRSNKRSRINQMPTNNRDELDDLFETNTCTKRRRTNNNNNNNNKQNTDVFDFNEPSTSTSTIRKLDNENIIGSCKVKRNIIDDDENKAIDELFNNDTRKKIRRQIKHEESTDILDMFKTRINTNIPQTTILSTMDDFKVPTSSKNLTTQKKIKMFFDDTDLISLREQVKQQNDIKDYIHVKPVVVTGGQWLSKEAETKSTCNTGESSDNPTTSDDIPEDQRNLMHIQYAPLTIDDQSGTSKKSKGSKNNSVREKSNKNVLDGKSFHKQLVLTDSIIVRKENLKSCYNALLEEINKPRIQSTSSSNKQKKTTKSKNSHDNEIILSDEEQIDNIDFFDLPTRKKKF
ncbi:unnamed protein product [Rotaria sp. Silwood2]|nr:unnamed protein product [Rotaria sp. Silwood2]CAF3932133.1 unnamed protein product [Rotaria sp. Silwood2]